MSSVFPWLRVLIAVVYSAHSGHGPGGTEELRNPLRRFAAFGDCLPRGWAVNESLRRRGSTAKHVGSHRRRAARSEMLQAFATVGWQRAADRLRLSDRASFWKPALPTHLANELCPQQVHDEQHDNFGSSFPLSTGHAPGICMMTRFCGDVGE